MSEYSSSVKKGLDMQDHVILLIICWIESTDDLFLFLVLKLNPLPVLKTYQNHKSDYSYDLLMLN